MHFKRYYFAIIILIIVNEVNAQRKTWEYASTMTTSWYAGDGCHAYFTGYKGQSYFDLRICCVNGATKSPIFIYTELGLIILFSDKKVRRFNSYRIRLDNRFVMDRLKGGIIYINCFDGKDWRHIPVNDSISKIKEFVNPKKTLKK